MKKLLVLVAIALLLPACTAKNSTPVAAPAPSPIAQPSPASPRQAEAAPSPAAAQAEAAPSAVAQSAPASSPAAAAPSSAAQTTSLPKASTTVYFLAISDQSPASEAPIPVANEATMRELITAAERGDLDKFEQLADSQSVNLMRGGSPVQVLSQKDNLVEVQLAGRDVDDNDLTGQTRWTAAQFVFSREAN